METLQEEDSNYNGITTQNQTGLKKKHGALLTHKNNKLPSKGSHESFKPNNNQAPITVTINKDQQRKGVQLKPVEIVAAERLKKQVEDYIKKRIEHLEVMRDQVERVQ